MHRIIFCLVFAAASLAGRDVFCVEYVDLPVHLFQSTGLQETFDVNTDLGPATLRFTVGVVELAEVFTQEEIPQSMGPIRGPELPSIYRFFVEGKECGAGMNNLLVRTAFNMGQVKAELLLGVTPENSLYFVLKTGLFTTSFLQNGGAEAAVTPAIFPIPSGLVPWQTLVETNDRALQNPHHSALFYVESWNEFSPIPVRDLAPGTNGLRPFALEHEVVSAARVIYSGDQNEVRIMALPLNPLALAFANPANHFRAARIFGDAARDLESSRPRTLNRLARANPHLRPHYLVNRWQKNRAQVPVVLNRAKLEEIGCSETFLQFAVSLMGDAP